MPPIPQAQHRQALLAANRAVITRIRDSVRAVPAHTLTRRPLNGGWSIAEVLEHLIVSADSYLAALRPLVQAKSSETANADATWKPTLMGGLLAASQRSPRKMSAPKRYRPGPMPGGKQIIRVHGPFVSDEEVRAVAEHWRKQGVPEYNQAVTEEPEDGGYLFDGQPTGEDDAETQLYRKAIQIVAESQKASTSYLQRQLRVGYNSAARLIERMEKDGLVGQPDHVGRREVLIDPDGHPI